MIIILFCHCHVQTEIGSEMLLNNAENYGQYFAHALMNENVNVSRVINETMAIVRDNISKQGLLK